MISEISASRCAVLIRGIQLVLSALTLSFSVVHLTQIWPYTNMVAGVLAGAFGIFFSLVFLIPPFLAYVSPGIVLASEIWVSLWWVVILGISARNYGGIDCYNLCMTTRSVVITSSLGFATSLLSLVLVISLSVDPLITYKQMWIPNSYLHGGIFLVPGFVEDSTMEYCLDVELKADNL